jgi:AraC-like DNA-binding protein
MKMTITLTQADFWELDHDTAVDWVEIPSSNYYEEACKLPKLLGKGHSQLIELCDGLELKIYIWEYQRAFMFNLHERSHEVELCFDIPAHHAQQNSRYKLFGSGIAPQEIEEIPAFGPGIHLSVHIEPNLLEALYADPAGELPPELQPLITPNEWQLRLRDRKLTSQMQTIIQQIVNCPYQGLIKQIYLQGKVFELLAIQIELLQFDQGVFPNYRLERATVDRVYQARDMLLANLGQSPSILELAQQVGMSDRTLRRGFRQVFGTTVVGYLTDKRLELAEQMLRQQAYTIEEVANLTGYSSRSHFAVAFKRKFGITPKACLLGQKSVS